MENIYRSLKKKFSTKRSTRVFIEEHKIFVKYHSTIVAEIIFGQGQNYVIFRHGGHKTLTTKARINDTLRILGIPGRVYQHKYAWYYASHNNTQELINSLTIPFFGEGDNHERV